jgi:hypothetical protein
MKYIAGFVTRITLRVSGAGTAYSSVAPEFAAGLRCFPATLPLFLTWRATLALKTIEGSK